MNQISSLLVAFAMFGVIFSVLPPAYSQTTDTSDQTILDGDLLNDPVAQEILKKIENSKKWIADLEYREGQKDELEEKQAEALASLQKDLKAWETLWEEFTFDYAFERKTGIFWDQYNFTNSKIQAGRDALQVVLSEGGNAEEARSAYVNAAKMKCSEIMEANSLFNVKRGFAYYNQQILFDTDGQFHDIVSGDQLRKYYQDFRTSPVYLDANPNDEASWEEISVSIQAECREGQVLIHRFNTNDYVCVTEQTSEMWTRHKMGKPMMDYVIRPTGDDLTTEKFREDTMNEKIKNINNKINTIYVHYGEKIQDLGKKYDAKLIDMKKLQRETEKVVTTKFERDEMSQEKFSQEMKNIRDNYQSLEQIMLKEKDQILKIMESNHGQYVREFIKNFESISDVKIVWSSDVVRYHAARI